jgi:hypothetical protein
MRERAANLKEGFEIKRGSSKPKPGIPKPQKPPPPLKPQRPPLPLKPQKESSVSIDTKMCGS